METNDNSSNYIDSTSRFKLNRNEQVLKSTSTNKNHSRHVTAIQT